MAPIDSTFGACTTAIAHLHIAMIQSHKSVLPALLHDDEAFCGEEIMRNLG